MHWPYDDCWPNAHEVPQPLGDVEVCGAVFSKCKLVAHSTFCDSRLAVLEARKLRRMIIFLVDSQLHSQLHSQPRSHEVTFGQTLTVDAEVHEPATRKY